MRRFLKRIFTYPLLLTAGAAILVEEALWRLSAIIALLGRLPVFRNLENWLRGLPPFGALAMFGLPALALAPVKLLALYWLAGGHPALGIGTILTAKVAGTALVARLFQLTQPQLLSIAWFRWLYDHVMRLRAAAYALWAESAVGRWWRRERARQKGWIRRRWDAARARLARK
ncbi:MAG TPA: hypothetical protein VFQ91_21480 [Bryobacteraceae bacterium]|nr:hypothetical protein [Bryobacteraceae bacterium]